MPVALSQISETDPRIHELVGHCGHIIRSTTRYYDEILAGTRRVWLDCKQCERTVLVTAIDRDRTRYCSSSRCPYPEVPLSRYNSDPEQRCNLCMQRDTDEWIALLQAPVGDRHRIRTVLSDEPLTAPQIELRCGVSVSNVYRHLTELMAMGEVKKLDQKDGPARYALAADVLPVAA